MDDVSTVREKLSEILPELAERLRPVAQELFRDRGCLGADTLLPGTTESAKTLVSNTLYVILKDNLWEKVSRIEELLPYAIKVMKRDFYDLVKNPRYRLTVDDPELERQAMSTLYSPDNVFEEAEAADLFACLKDRKLIARTEQEEAYLRVIIFGDSVRKVDIARELGISLYELEKIRKRILRRLKPLKQGLTNGAEAKIKKV
jgi:hypothetical protein